ncbi:MAG: FHA domain-containing protein [Solirubrobacterales bacterium]|nr:FHA domain-containing protein [Solirubrobacterales bacterium]
MTSIGNSTDALRESGERAGAGSFLCRDCSLPLSLDHSGALPSCPNCGGTEFKRASMFAEQPTLSSPSVSAAGQASSSWLNEARASIEAPGKYMATFVDGRVRVFELHAGWSRIGRAASADIRLDDPTVSRRHAVVVCTPEGELRVLDDRSMNGLTINGETVDWAPVVDGDELEIGRYTLHVIETSGL